MAYLINWLKGRLTEASTPPGRESSVALRVRLHPAEQSVRERLSDKVEDVFRLACQSNDWEVAEAHLDLLEHMHARPRMPRDVESRASNIPIERLREDLERYKAGRSPAPVIRPVRSISTYDDTREKAKKTVVQEGAQALQRQRLSDRVEDVFTAACQANDVEVAERLLDILDRLHRRVVVLSSGERRVSSIPLKRLETEFAMASAQVASR